MKATFLYAVRYWIQAECLTPLRTGGADGDVEMVLTDFDGSLFVQGSSLAGAMRQWMEENEQQSLVESLFGSQRQSGKLIVSDAGFSPEAQQSLRPRLRIDGETGSAAPGGKFDVAQVNAGARFSFYLTWLGMDSGEEETSAIERALSALNVGDICLGAQKSNGFGRVKIEVKKYWYSLKNSEDREKWMDDRECGQSIFLPKIQERGKVHFTLFGRADSILVKAAVSKQTEDGRTVMKNLEEIRGTEKKLYPILPGSSIKGAIRGRAQLIVQSTGQPESLVEELFGRGAGPEDQGKPGRVRFEDVCLNMAKKKKISRIRINRFTGGVIRGGLFQEEALCSDIRLNITAPYDQPAGCALLLYALRDLALGLYNLGSGGAIGRGYLQVDRIEVTGAKGESAVMDFRSHDGCNISDPDGVFSDWMQAWKEGLR